jgi:serine/threonine protein kinase
MASRRAHTHGPHDIIGGKYRVHRVIGVGGMAVVYEAEDMTVGRRVAIKVIHADVAHLGQVTKTQMEDEGRILVGLAQQTDHVVEVLTAGVTDDKHRLPYYVMELLRGYTLRYVIERKRAEGRALSVYDASGVVQDLAFGLMHAHKSGIVHRDVKPENAFVHKRRDGSVIVKLLDFGVGAWAGRRDRDVGFKGTYRYAAPEQHLTAARTAVGPPADVYAAGLVFYELLALRTPFEDPEDALDAEELVHAHIAVEPPSILRFRPDVPMDVAALIASCLHKDPAHRPEDAYELARRLDTLRRRLDPASTRTHVEAITDIGMPLPFAADATEPDAPPFVAIEVEARSHSGVRIDSHEPVVTTGHPSAAAMRAARGDRMLLGALALFTGVMLLLTAVVAFMPARSRATAAVGPSGSAVLPMRALVDAGHGAR